MALEALKEFDDEYESFEPEKKAFENVPDGKYQAQITSAKMDIAKNSGADQLSLEITIISGSFKNRKLFKNSQLQTRENIEWLKSDLEKIEVNITKLSNLDEELEKFKGLTIEVYVKNKKGESKDFYNVYFNKRLNIILPDNSNGETSDAMFDDVSGSNNDKIPF